jgi:hypothetical protein
MGVNILISLLLAYFPYFERTKARLAWSHDPESYNCGSVATGRVSHDGQVKGDDPHKKGSPGPPGWWLCIGFQPPPGKKNLNCCKAFNDCSWTETSKMTEQNQ